MDFKNVINPVTGEISTVGIAGAKLYDTLRPIAEGTKSVATEMKTAKQPIADIATYLDKQRANFVKLGTDAGLSKELVERAYDHMIGANPKELITLIKAEGINEANEKLKNYKGTLDEVDAYHAVADIAGDDKVLGVKLADAYTDLNAWDKAVGTAQAGLDPKEADAVRKRLLLDLFNLAQTNPTVRANMDPRLLNEVLADANKDLDELEKRKPSPLVSAQIEEAKRRIQTIMDMMWNLDHHRATAIVSVQTVYTTKGTPAPQGFVVRPGDPMPNANGNILNGAGRVVKHFANGGIERHVAQITKPGSPMRVWSEPETQGEAYLPYAMSKRPRSVAILAQVAKDFGYTINRAEQFANGGITGSTSTSHTSADVHIGSITTVDMHQAVAKLRQSQRDALAVAGISSIGV
jgi:hypothetical protein